MSPPSDHQTFDEVLAAATATTTANANAATAANPGTGQPAKRFLVPGIDAFLGHGYDVFGEFASPNSVKARIYDLPNETTVEQPTIDQSFPLSPEQLSHTFIEPPKEVTLTYARPEKVGYRGVFQASIDVNEIDTSNRDTNSWGIGARLEGGYGGFTGEIKGRFDTKSTKLATTKCLQATFQTIYWKLDVADYTFESPPPIVADVKQDFAKRSIEDLMAKYGTHCLEDIGIGTKIVHSYTIDTSKFSKEIDVTAALKAKYEAASFHAGVEVEGEYHDAAWRDRSAVSIKIFTYGTSDTQLAEITDLSQGLGQHPLAVLRQGWHNPTLIKFYDSSLKPLWKVEGLMTPEKAQAFEAGFTAKAAAAQAEIGYLFQGLQPVYLLSRSTGDRKKYRLERKPHYRSGDKDWAIENDGKPWLYLSAKPRPGMAQLLELVLNDDTDTVRYETEVWGNVLARLPIEGYAWSRSGRTLGYVYENRGPDGPPIPADACPVYAFYDKDGQASRGIFYSFLRELVWDSGQWKPLEEGRIIDIEFRRAAQARLDREWDSHDWFYKAFHEKPQLGEFHGGFAGDATGDPAAAWLFTFGIPHWYALNSGSTPA
jgi:hypothetical protein